MIVLLMRGESSLETQYKGKDGKFRCRIKAFVLIHLCRFISAFLGGAKNDNYNA